MPAPKIFPCSVLSASGNKKNWEEGKGDENCPPLRHLRLSEHSGTASPVALYA